MLRISNECIKVTMMAMVTVALLTSSSIIVEATKCLDSINTIYESEKAVIDDSDLREYILCPKTIFRIASQFQEDGTPIDGQYPIPLSRSNMHVLCGEDGKSENNCILTGGIVHVGFVDEFDTGKKLKNMLLKGISSQKATSANLIATNDGELSVHDCIFKNNKNVASIYASQGVDRRKLLHAAQDIVSQNISARESLNERKLNDILDESNLFIEINSCSFLKNTIDFAPGALKTAIIMSDGVSMGITNSAFAGTQLGPREHYKSDVSQIISMTNADLFILDTCFIGNSDEIAPIFSIGTGIVHNSNNFVQRTSNSISTYSCEFITSITSEEGSATCTQAQSTVCSCNASWKDQIPCLESLNDIYYSEKAVFDDSFARTYILCPGTTYRIASNFDENGIPLDGLSPIIIGRSNLSILCGIDGNSSNGCIIHGGSVQMALSDEFNSMKPVVHAVVQGLTFTHAKLINVLSHHDGDLIMLDCIFQDNNNHAIIYSEPSADRRRLRHISSSLVDSLYDTNRRREREEGSIFIDLEGCSFVNNKIGSSVATISGLVYVRNSVVSIVESLFQNTVNIAEEGKIAFLVGSFDGKVDMVNNCFFDNEQTIAPVVLEGLSFVNADANSGSLGAAPICEFIAEVQSGSLGTTQLHETTFECTNYDAGDTCTLL